MKHTYKYDHYYLYNEIDTIVRGYAEKYPQYCKLDIIGTTTEGREIVLLEITDTATGDYADKPAFYLEGNLHAGEVTGSMTVMYFMDTVFSNLDDPAIAKLLKKHTIYCLPRVSPDGSEYYLTTPYSVRSVNRYFPYAEEQPGLQPFDLDGDGAVRMMRVKTPYGIWKTSPVDSRLMVKRQPDDDEGDFYNVYTEGALIDWDGLQIKDAPAKYGYDFNRNFPIGWAPQWLQNGAGETPMCNPETQANGRFILSHKNICSCVDMHTSGGQVLYTPGYKKRSECEAADIELYKAIGAMATEENGFPLLNVYEEYMPADAPVTYGGFDDFCHFIGGVPCFTIECWDLDARSGIVNTYPPKEPTQKQREEEEYKILQWIDANVPEGEGFKPWTKFVHPQLGEVEIGGISGKFISQNPPKAFLEQEVEKHTRFLLRDIKCLPEIVFDSVKAEPFADGIYRLEVIVGNHGFMSSYVFKEGLKNPQLKPLTVSISGMEDVLEGKTAQKIGHLEGLNSIKAGGWGFPARSIETSPVAKKLTWLIKAKPGDTVTVTCAGGRIGKAETTVTL